MAGLNAIPETQNSARAMRVRRASQQTYLRASRLQVIQLVSTVVLPVAGALFALAHPEYRPWVALGSLVLIVVDVAFLDRSQRKLIKLAAKLSEKFDSTVLDMPWNSFTAGSEPDPETIAEASTAWSKRRTDEKIVDWYPVVVGRPPLHMARIVCQRTNLWYDATLRRQYADVVALLLFATIVVAVIAAFASKMSVEDMVLLATPAAPVAVWALREHFRQKDTAEAQETAKGQADALWRRLQNGECDEAEAEARSRDFQVAIYTRRATSPLMFPLVYRLRRKGMEANMNAAAEDLVEELGY